MDKVIEYCDKIITSTQYHLAAEYFSIFNNNNHTNKELIFAVDQRLILMVITGWLIFLYQEIIFL